METAEPSPAFAGAYWSVRFVERYAEIRTLPRGRWRAWLRRRSCVLTVGEGRSRRVPDIKGYGDTRDAAVREAASVLQSWAAQNDPWAGTYGATSAGSE